MGVGLLFSGGTDSTLAALLLDRFYDVTLITVHFGVTDDWRHGENTAEAVGLPFEALELDRTLADDAVDRILEDGYARNGIQLVHLAALEAVAIQSYETIADGTRRDDRVPWVSRAKAQQLEQRHDVDYVAPLSGFGRRAVDRLVERELEVDVGPSQELDRADYEAELRALCIEAVGEEAAIEVFPSREQTAVTGRR